MDPRLQNAFEVMYAKAEMFIELPLAKKCTEFIRMGDIGTAAGVAADALISAQPKGGFIEWHTKAVVAFGEFWSVFTTIRKEGK